MADLTGDVRRLDVEVGAVVVMVGSQSSGAVEWEVAASKPAFVGDDESDESFDRAAERVAAASLGNNLASALVLLDGEVKPSAGGEFEVNNGVVEIEFSGPKVEMDVVECESLVGPPTAL